MKEEMKVALKEAMKAKNQVVMNTLRAALTAIQYEEVAKGTENLPATEITEILKREVKKRKEEMEFAEKANRPEALDALKLEISTLERFLPKQMSASELEKLITKLKTDNPAANMGIVMKTLKEQHAGLYDSKMASELAKKIAG